MLYPQLLDPQLQETENEIENRGALIADILEAEPANGNAMCVPLSLCVLLRLCCTRPAR